MLSPVTASPVEAAVTVGVTHEDPAEVQAFLAGHSATSQDHWRTLNYVAHVGLDEAHWRDTPFMATRVDAIRLAATFIGGGLLALAALERHATPELARRALLAWQSLPAATRAAVLRQRSLRPLAQLLDALASGKLRASERSEAEVLRFLYPVIESGDAHRLRFAVQVLACEAPLTVTLLAGKARGRVRAEGAPAAGSDAAAATLPTNAVQRGPKRRAPRVEDTSDDSGADRPAPALADPAFRVARRPAASPPPPPAARPSFAVTDSNASTPAKDDLFAIIQAALDRAEPAARPVAASLPAPLSAPMPVAKAENVSAEVFAHLARAAAPVAALLPAPLATAAAPAALLAAPVPPVVVPAGTASVAFERHGSSYEIVVPSYLVASLMQLPAPVAGMQERHLATVNQREAHYSLALLRTLVFGPESG